MKRKLIILNILFIVSLSLCTIKKEPFGDSTYTTLINKSGHTIELQEFYNENFRKSSFIDNSQSEDFNTIAGEGGPNGSFIRLLASTDSILIIYSNKASIWHTSNVNSAVSRSLMLESSYIGGKVSDGLYEFTYTFTPADYEEALEFGD